MGSQNDQADGGVLPVGSIPLADAETVFTQLPSSLPGRLRSIPDGETGERNFFVQWQTPTFPPEVLFGKPNLPVGSESLKDRYTVESLKSTRYDDFAITSYAEFLALRKKGVIPPDVRFQVCLPTPINVTVFRCKPEFVPVIEPLYEEQLKRSIQRIVDTIPHDDLVIQWDLPCETLALEYERGAFTFPPLKMWFEPAMDGFVERLKRLNSVIPSDVWIGIHLCYGDRGHKHTYEPKDTGLMVEFAHHLVKALGDKHHIAYMHMPVPIDRTDVEYVEPLQHLRLQDHTHLCLGLVHPRDEAGTRKRIANAKSVYSRPFGVATECGLGRTPAEDIDSILEISKNVTTPLK